jgi:hypothetical protein
LGNARKLRLEVRNGTRLRVDGQWVETRQEGELIVGWTSDRGGEPVAFNPT